MTKDQDWEQVERAYLQRFPADLQREWKKLSPHERRDLLASLRELHEKFEEQVYQFLLGAISSFKRSG